MNKEIKKVKAAEITQNIQPTTKFEDGAIEYMVTALVDGKIRFEQCVTSEYDAIPDMKKVNKNLSCCIRSLAHRCMYFYLDNNCGEDYTIQVSGIDVNKYLEV